VYLHSKFQAKWTKDAKVMNKKLPTRGQGDKKKDKCFLQSPCTCFELFSENEQSTCIVFAHVH